jgi:hypothetical protein
MDRAGLLAAQTTTDNWSTDHCYWISCQLFSRKNGNNSEKQPIFAPLFLIELQFPQQQL